MNKLNNKFLKTFFVSLMILIINFTTSHAAQGSGEPQIYSTSTILMDAKSGQILQEHDSHKTVYPASTTKLMTAIIVLENCNPSDPVTVSQDALNGIPISYTVAHLQAGETFTVEELLNVLLIPSANDVANVLAYHVAGSLENFSEMMNARAQELGAKDTHFVNPSGIHNDNHYSTAYDMALIGKYANKFPAIVEISKKTECSLPNLPDGTERKFKTTNTLITPDHNAYYEPACGMKTGYTDKAKSCIVAKAMKDDKELICVVLGGPKIDDNNTYRDVDCRSLFDYGFNNFTYSTICKKGELIDMSSFDDISEELKNSKVAYDDTIVMLVNNNIPVTSEVKWNTDIQLPLRRNTVVGTVTYNVNGEEYTVDLITKDYVLTSYSKYLPYIFYGLTGFFALTMALTLISSKRKNRFHTKPRSSDDKQ